MTTTQLTEGAIIALPFRGNAQTIINENGTIAWFNGTFEEYQSSHPELDLKIVSWDGFEKLHSDYFTSTFKEISEERYFDALECLPPVKWHGIDNRWNVFFMSERLSGNITSCYLRDRTNEKFYAGNKSIYSNDAELIKMIEQEIEGLTIDNLKLITETGGLNTGHWLEENLLNVRQIAADRGYIRILSHTQCEWTEKGVERFK